MTRGTGITTRSRLMFEAPSTTWLRGNLLLQELPVRALQWLRKKLLFEASKVGLSAECRTRTELPDFPLGLGEIVFDGQGIGTPTQPDTPGSEQGKEPSKAYRQNLKQCADAVYVNLGTL